MIDKFDYDEDKKKYSGNISINNIANEININLNEKRIKHYEQFTTHLEDTNKVLKDFIVAEKYLDAKQYYSALLDKNDLSEQKFRDLLVITQLNFEEDEVEVFYQGGIDIFSNNKLVVLVSYEGEILSEVDLIG